MKRLEEDFSADLVAGGDRPLIVHVVRQFLPNRGGLEDVVYNLCRQGLRHGLRVRVVTLDSLFSDPHRALPAFENIDGIDIVRIPWTGSSRYPVALSVLKHVRDADLVHVHAVDFFYDFIALTRFQHRRPMIATTHGGFFHTKRFAALKAIWFQTLTRFSSSRYDYVVGCSRSDMQTFEPIARNRLTLIENGADTGKFHDLASKLPAKRIVTIGRFSSNKRLDRLLGAMRALVAIDPEWSLDIVGVASDLTVTDVGALTAGIEDKVRIHSGLSNSEIGAVISSSSIFASASEYEGFGLVAIEAMSAGLLPVLENNSAYSALAGRHRLIKLADFADPQRAAETLMHSHRTLLADPAGIRATLTIEAEAYSWDSVALRYLKLYRDALK